MQYTILLSLYRYSAVYKRTRFRLACTPPAGGGASDDVVAACTSLAAQKDATACSDAGSTCVWTPTQGAAQLLT